MILVFTDPTAQDYGADYLVHGLVDLLGPGRVCEWPRKASLHTVDVPRFDCDMNIDTARLSQDEVESFLRDRIFELVVVPTLRGTVGQRLYFWRHLLRLNQDRVVYYDAEDHATDTQPLFVQMAGVAPSAYFKRELPLDECWAKPLPFGYPAERVQPIDAAVGSGRETRAIYAVHIWEWAVGGLREQLAGALRRSGRCTVAASYGDTDRRSVQQYHAANRRHLVAVSPAGHGYGTNRHLEIIADGCCPVLERPWRQWPDAPHEGVECRYFTNEVECVDILDELINDPETAQEMAKAAQSALLRGHTTRHRANAVWAAIHHETL